MVPPEANVETTDWDKEESEQTPDKTEENEVPQEREMSDAELENIRRKLEGLL